MDETYPAPAAGELSGEGEGASPEDQAALIERIKLGDVELFLKLIQPHGKTLHAVCHSILQNDADAEEVAQETLLKALAHLEQLRTYQSFKSWLFQIAINEARRRLREQRSPLFTRPMTGWVPLRVAMDRANGYMRMMMGCAQVVPQLTKYIDGNLDPDQRRKIERHLRLCRYCAVLVDSIRKLLYIVG